MIRMDSRGERHIAHGENHPHRQGVHAVGSRNSRANPSPAASASKMNTAPAMAVCCHSAELLAPREQHVSEQEGDPRHANPAQRRSMPLDERGLEPTHDHAREQRQHDSG
jgi:hypothetical protein